MFAKNLIKTILSCFVLISWQGIAADGDLKWSYVTGGEIISSPTIGDDGTVYVGSYDNNVYALNPDGTLKWSFVTDGDISSVAVIDTDGTIYFGSLDNKVYAVNSDGSLKWSYETSGDINSWPSVGVDGTVYIGSDDSNVYALNNDGTLKWTYDTGGFVRSSPTIALDGTIYFGSYDNQFYALNSDGSLKWSHTAGDAVAGTPSIDADGTIYIGSFDNKLYALNPDDGSVKWSFSAEDNIRSSPSIAIDGTIYFGSYDGKVYAVNNDGSLQWAFETGESLEGSASITSDGTIYIGSGDAKFYALNADGSLKREYTTGGIVFSSPAVASDGTIYIGSFDGSIYAFEGSFGLMQSPWPRIGLNSRGTSLSGEVDPPNSQIQLSEEQYSVAEEAGNVVITITRINGTSGDVTVDVVTSDISAFAASDYQSENLTITMLDGESSKTVQIVILDDSDIEQSETFAVNLSNVTGEVTFGDTLSTTITIVNDDVPSPGSLALSNSTYSVNENAGDLTITINRTGGSLGDASVNYSIVDGSATSGNDYSATAGTANFSDGELSKTFTISIVDDANDESTENFTVNLSDAVGASLGTQITATISIVDNDSTPATGGQSSSGGGALQLPSLLLLGSVFLFNIFSRRRNQKISFRISGPKQ